MTSLAGLLFDRPYWTSIEVNGGGEMTPRRPMTTAPYAFRAKYADTAARTDTAGYATNAGTAAVSLSSLGGVTDTDWSYASNDTIYHLTGNVGIGTNAPLGRLSITGTTSDSSAVAFHILAANGTNRVAIRNNGAAYFGGGDFVIGGSAINQGSLILHNYNYGLSKYEGGYLYLHSSDAIGFGRLIGNYPNYTDRDANFVRQMVLMQDGRLNIGPGSGYVSDSLTVQGSIRADSGLIIDSPTLVVDATNNRVGIGTASPTQALNVIGTVLANRIYNDSGVSIANRRIYNRYRLDGNIGIHLQDDTTAGLGDIHVKYYYPLRFFQVLPNVEVLTLGSGAGNTNVGIGETAPAYPLHMASGAHVTAGGVWTNASSRKLKHDISSLSGADYAALLARLDQIEVVRYRYNAETTGEEHLGVIAEDAPAEIVTPDRSGVPTGDAIGYLLAVVKALREQNERLEERIHQLEITGSSHTTINSTGGTP